MGGSSRLPSSALAALVRYRAMVPFAYLLLAAEHIGRRLIVQSLRDPPPGGDVEPGSFYINAGLLALLIVGLALSLWQRKKCAAALT